jgi:nicotinamide mononucleotide transporter
MFTPSYYRDFIEGMLVGLFLTGISYFLGYYLNWFSDDVNYSNLTFEATCVLLNFSCVYLATRQSIMQWPIGIAASMLIGILCLQQNLLASFFLQSVFFVAAQILGWFVWWRGNGPGERDNLHVSNLSFPHIISAIIFVPIIWYGAKTVTEYYGGNLAGFDGAILVFSVIAQWFMNFKKLECWIMWIAVNVISIYVFSTSGLYLLAFQYMLFLGNAFYGLYQWFNSWKFYRAHIS